MLNRHIKLRPLPMNRKCKLRSPNCVHHHVQEWNPIYSRYKSRREPRAFDARLRKKSQTLLEYRQVRLSTTTARNWLQLAAVVALKSNTARNHMESHCDFADDNIQRSPGMLFDCVQTVPKDAPRGVPLVTTDVIASGGRVLQASRSSTKGRPEPEVRD